LIDGARAAAVASISFVFQAEPVFDNVY